MSKGKTILSCGHEDVDGCMGVPVQFDDEDCVAGEGFIPVTVYAQYCHDCAKTLHFGLGKDAGRAEQAAEIERLRERLEIDPAHSIDGIYARDETIRGLETELAKFKALAETLAGALEKLHEAYCADDYGTSEGRAFGRAALIETREALREYKEATNV